MLYLKIRKKYFHLKSKPRNFDNLKRIYFLFLPVRYLTALTIFSFNLPTSQLIYEVRKYGLILLPMLVMNFEHHFLTLNHFLNHFQYHIGAKKLLLQFLQHLQLSLELLLMGEIHQLYLLVF